MAADRGGLSIETNVYYTKNGKRRRVRRGGQKRPQGRPGTEVSSIYFCSRAETSRKESSLGCAGKGGRLAMKKRKVTLPKKGERRYPPLNRTKRKERDSFKISRSQSMKKAYGAGSVRGGFKCTLGKAQKKKKLSQSPEKDPS